MYPVSPAPWGPEISLLFAVQASCPDFRYPLSSPLIPLIALPLPLRRRFTGPWTAAPRKGQEKPLTNQDSVRAPQIRMLSSVR